MAGSESGPIHHLVWETGDLFVSTLWPYGLQFEDRVELADGTLFPRIADVRVRPWSNESGTPTGPWIDLRLEVENGQPVVTYFGVTRAEGDPPITPSDIRRLPLGKIVEQVVDTTAKTLAAMNYKPGPPPSDFWQGPAAVAGSAAVSAHRGRPPTEMQIQMAAKIAKHNRYDPRQEVARALMVSPRTASRLLAEARRRGLIELDSEEE
jgi:hypothetical protein